MSAVQIRAADWIQCDVELSHESDNVDEQAQVRAPDAESGPEGELVQGMTVGMPCRWLVTEERSEKCSLLLTRPCGSGYEPERYHRR